MRKIAKFLLFILAVSLFISSLSGCGLFREKERPMTTTEWIGQPRPGFGK